VTRLPLHDNILNLGLCLLLLTCEATLSARCCSPFLGLCFGLLDMALEVGVALDRVGF
jgi:hypothetical protein